MNEVPVKANRITDQIQAVLQFIAQNGFVTDVQIEELLGVKHTRAYNLTREMLELGLIRAEGKGKAKKYYLLKI